jgi:hypothetical protein
MFCTRQGGYEVVIHGGFSPCHIAGGNSYDNVGMFGSNNTFRGAGQQGMNMGGGNPERPRGTAIRSYASPYGNPELEYVYLVSHIPARFPQTHRTSVVSDWHHYTCCGRQSSNNVVTICSYDYNMGNFLNKIWLPQ